MDILTQGLLGSAVAQSGANTKHTKLATLIGFFSGLLADADVFIRSSADPLLSVEYHRHFTHSIFFIPIGALIACLVFYPLLKQYLGIKQLYYYCLLGYLFSGTLDLCTSYGTYWLWPLFDERFALHIIGIVDLFFTPVLLIAVILCLFKKNPMYARIGLIICVTYLAIGFVQLHRATLIAENLIAERNHHGQRLLVKPSPGTLFLWRSVYEHDDHYYTDAIHVSWKQRVYEGESIERYRPERDLPHLNPTSLLARDIQRFTKFSDGYIAASPENPLIIGDMRYALLPNSTKPLWGITIDPQNPSTHVQYAFYRRNNERDRQIFVRMMLGKNIL